MKEYEKYKKSVGKAKQSGDKKNTDKAEDKARKLQQRKGKGKGDDSSS